MLILKTFRKVKSAVASKVVLPSDTIQNDETAILGGLSKRPYACFLHQGLSERPKWGQQQAQDFWDAIEDFKNCIDGSEEQLKGKEELKVLQGELETLLEQLRLCYNQDTSRVAVSTKAVKALSCSIKNESGRVRESQVYSRDVPFVQRKSISESEVLACYHRVHNHLQRIQLNISTWQDKSLVEADIELTRLIHDAPPWSYRGYSPRTQRGPCMEGTRVDVLRQIHDWIDNPNSSSVYWIIGMAGTGKTTVAYSLCEKLDNTHKLAASLFCSRDMRQCQDISSIIPSIAYQIAQFSGPFRFALLDKLNSPNFHADDHTSLDAQFDRLVYQPLLSVKNALPRQLVVVIDAIDECADKDMTTQLLGALHQRLLDLPLKFVVSCRPEPQIRAAVEKLPYQETSRVILHEVDKRALEQDIKRYLVQSQIFGMCLPGIWILGEEEMAALVKRAGTLFACAAAIKSYISGKTSTEGTGASRLANILESSSASEAIYSEEVDSRYTFVLREALNDTNLNEIDKDDIRLVLYLFACSRKPLPIDAISELLSMDVDRIWAALRPLWSVLHVSKDSETVTTLHPSFSEYLHSPSRSGDYYCDPKVYDQAIALGCFNIFRNTERQFNICRLDSSYVPDHMVPELEMRVQADIPNGLSYAARNWAAHLRSAPESAELLQALEDFVSSQLLLWMEVMNLNKCAFEMPEALQIAKEWAESCNEFSTHQRALLIDAQHFITAFTLGEIFNNTPHIYISMLPLWPKSSLISALYSERIQGAVRAEVSRTGNDGGALLATWNFSNHVESPTYSPDGKQIVMGLGNDVLLLSSSTGQMVHPPFRGHSGLVLAVEFSPDGTRIASSSLDKSIRVWGTKNGDSLLGPLVGHDTLVNSIVYSPHGTLIISGSIDGTIFAWDAQSGERLLHPITGHHGSIYGIEYSLKNPQIITCHWNHVAVRSSQDGRILATLNVSNDIPLASAAISLAGTRIACCSRGIGIYVWDIQSEQPVLGPAFATSNCSPFTSIAFSPDGSQLISGSKDGTIWVWDVQSGSIRAGPLEGHTGSITSVKFSPDGVYIISGSDDQTLRIWGVPRAQSADSTDECRGHTASVTSVSFSPDSRRIVSGSSDRTTSVWDVESGTMALGPVEKGGNQISVAFSPDGTRILSSSHDGLVLLDSETGKVTLGPVQLDQPIQSAVFSSDGNQVVLGSTKDIVKVVEANTGLTLMEISPPVTDRSDWMTSVIPSPDGARIAVGLLRSGICMYEAHNGRLIYGPLEGHNNGPRSLTFSPDSTRIAYGSFSTIIVRDTQTGEMVLGPLEGHTGWVHSVEYSPDGKYIVSGARDSAICMWSSQTGMPVIGPIKWHTGPVKSVKFSPDGTRLVSCSDDKTIRVTDIQMELTEASKPSTTAGSDWAMNEQGWVVDGQGRLLIWIPPHLRTMLIWPQTKLLISRRGWIRLNFDDAYLGESWTKCYRLESSDRN